MMHLSRLDCLLMIWTIALLSQWNTTARFARLIPKICRATTIGYNSRKAMFLPCQSTGNPMTNQELLKVAAHACFDASVYMWSEMEDSASGWMNIVFPLWNWKNVSHILISAVVPSFKVTKWEGFLTPIVVSINRLTKALPGMITEVANCRHPMTLCIFSRVVFWCFAKSVSFSRYLSNFSAGSRASISTEDNSTPKNTINLEGSRVFSGHSGIFNSLHKDFHAKRYWRHFS